uniref:Uncharacterized protein n=1 Tax=Meloidogyne floridensis TaxID=298350 RepID=A0A915NR38_9BILA
MLFNRLFARCTCLSASQAICRSFSENATLVKSTQTPVKLKKEEIELELSNVLRNEENALQNVRPWQQLELLPIHNFKHVVCLQKNFLFKRKKWDERRALMDPGVKLLHYPYTPSTPPPEYLDSSQWNEAFTSARIFLLGTKHDTIKSVRLLMSAVHADFVFLGMSSSQAELLIGSNKLELMPKYSQESTEKFLVERLKKEGITDIPKALSKMTVKAHLKNLHTLRQHCQKYMCKYSEFTFARNALPETIPEKLDRLVDLAEEFLIEHILLQLDPNRPPRIDYNQLDILLGWARDLIEWADYKESFSFKLEQEKGDSGWGKLLQEDNFKKAANWFDKFMDETFPDGRQAMILLDHFEPLTVIAIVGHRHVPGICEIWERPEEVFTVETE